MIAWSPGNIQAGTICEEPLANWDILPTLCEITNQKVPGTIDGISFYNVLLHQSKQKHHAYLYWEFFERGFDQALRAGDWKMVVRSANEGRTELYNLKDDSGEQRDVSVKFPEKVKALRKVMESAREDSEEFPVKK
jgi:arylsulfatase A-like enzyme